MGKFEEAIEQSKEVLRLDPDLPVGYSMLAANYGYLNQLTEARNVLRMASTRGLNNPDFVSCDTILLSWKTTTRKWNGRWRWARKTQMQKPGWMTVRRLHWHTTGD
jgi:hypothetical protein